MRFSTIAVALLSVAASASADNGIFRRQDSYPSCAIQCTTNADLGGCQVTDYHCLCTNQSFVSSVTRCLYSSCSGDDLQRALTLSQQLCAKVGVTLTSAAASASASPTASRSGASSTSHNALFGLGVAALAAFGF